MTEKEETWKPFELSQWEQPLKLKLDNTKRSTFVQCKRKYFYQYIMGYKPATGSTALRYGIAWHGAMEGFYSHIAQHGWSRDGKALEAGVLKAQKEWDRATDSQEFYEDYRTLQNLMQAFITYIDHFASDEGMLTVIEPEQVFTLYMGTDPETGKWTESEDEGHDSFVALSPFYFTGRLDAEIELNGLPWTMEHKSTGQQLTIQNTRLHRQAQFMGYTYAAKRNLEVLPQGSLIVIHHLSAYKSRKTGLYGKPKIDFSRTPQIFDEGDLINWKVSLLSTAMELQIEMERNLWPMQHDSCYQYGRCTFCNICEQNRPIGQENLEGYYIAEPWDVTKEES